MHRTRSAGVSSMALLAVVTLLASMIAVTLSPTADAAGRLTVSSELGGNVASADGPTRFDIRGSGYQTIQGGFGGIYVAFGWVDRSWRPSAGGVTGVNYHYVPDSETRNNQGYLGFIAFPGSSTAGEAHGIMAANGSWNVTLNIPGPRFTAEDRNGRSVNINCLEVTCGFMTFGAHGVTNANNEAFEPVTFQAGGGGGGGNGGGGGGAGEGTGDESAAGGGGAAAGQNGEQARGAAQRAQAQGAAPRVRGESQGGSTVGGGGGGSAAGGGDDGPGEEGSASGGGGGSAASGAGGSATGAIEIEVDRASARPGGALSYTAYGFWPGEQATVTLGQGVAAVGPLTTGVDGEIAGVLMLPDDIEPGTHEIRAVGAGSGLSGSERFAVSDPALVSSEGPLAQLASPRWGFFGLALLALLVAAGWVLSRRLAARSGGGSGEPDGDSGHDGPGGGPDGEWPGHGSDGHDPADPTTARFDSGFGADTSGDAFSETDRFYGAYSDYPAQSDARS